MERENRELVIEECYILAIIHVALNLELCTHTQRVTDCIGNFFLLFFLQGGRTAAAATTTKMKNEIKLSLTTDIHKINFQFPTSATTSFLLCQAELI